MFQAILHFIDPCNNQKSRPISTINGDDFDVEPEFTYGIDVPADDAEGIDYTGLNDGSDSEPDEDNEPTFDDRYDPSRDAWDASEIRSTLQDSGDMSQFPTREAYQSQVDEEGACIVKALKKVSSWLARTTYNN